MYRVANWDTHFEGAKSKGYNNKTACQMPTKHGLGYRKLVRAEDGPAMFGAWCAMIQILSRHPKPRSGYITESGDKNGAPYTPDDLAMLTDIPARLFAKMLKMCASQSVGWLAVVTSTDTTGIPLDPAVSAQYPLHSDSDLDLDSDLDSCPPTEKIGDGVRACMDMVTRLYQKNSNINLVTASIAAMVKEDGISVDRIEAACVRDAVIQAHFRPLDDPKAFRKDFAAIEQSNGNGTTRQTMTAMPTDADYEAQQTIGVDENGDPVF